ncbi:hypothetical protein HZ326_28362 [Fusarium oxysporum f. sp. albedinis]|jgi:hypothetical protein|nr:hypothetical protein HZ326_28362 [Fusarium oxysporum f. sp. albedinis]
MLFIMRYGPDTGLFALWKLLLHLSASRVRDSTETLPYEHLNLLPVHRLSQYVHRATSSVSTMSKEERTVASVTVLEAEILPRVIIKYLGRRCISLKPRR